MHTAIISAALISVALTGCGAPERAAAPDEFAAARAAKAAAWPSRSAPYLADAPRSIAAVWPQGIPIPPSLVEPTDPLAWAIGKTPPAITGPDPSRPSPWRRIVAADEAEPIIVAWGDHTTGSAAWIAGTARSYRLTVAPVFTGETALDGSAMRSRVLPVESKPIAMIGATAADADDPALLVLLADGQVVEGRGRTVLDGDAAWALVRRDDAAGPAVHVQLRGGRSVVLRPTALGGWRRDDETKGIAYPAGADARPWTSRAAVGALALSGGLDYAAQAEANEQPVVMRPNDTPWIIATDSTVKAQRIALLASEDGRQTNVVTYMRSGESRLVAQGDTVPGGAMCIVGHPSHLVVVSPSGLWAVPFEMKNQVKPAQTAMPNGGVAWWASAGPSENYVIFNGDVTRMGGRVGFAMPEARPQRQLAWTVQHDGKAWVIGAAMAQDYALTLSRGMAGLQTTWPADWPATITARWAMAADGFTDAAKTTPNRVVWPRIEAIDERAIAQAWPSWDGSLLPGPKPVVDDANDRVVLGDGGIVRRANDGSLTLEPAP